MCGWQRSQRSQAASCTVSCVEWRRGGPCILARRSKEPLSILTPSLPFPLFFVSLSAELADASAETYEAALAQEKATAGGATVIGFLRARLAAAVYTGFRVAPYSSMLTNAALCTVEEGALLARAMHKAYRRRAATAKMNKREATLVEQTAARLELLELEKTSGPGVVVAGLEMAGRCAGSVVSEVACTTVGAFLAPGVGALVGQLLGSVVCWLL